MEKRPFKMGVVAAACCSVSLLVGGVVAYAVSGTPEIDRANATFQLSGRLTSVGCVGEDSTDYVTYSGTWKGAETQVTPDATDYPLSGPVTVSGIKWTINSQTGRGVLTGTISQTGTAAANVPVYKGKLTLITQGQPTAGAAVPARGWISAPIVLPDEGVSPGDDSLIANVEFAINSGGANGEFGDLPSQMNIPAFSAVTNVAPKALDGTC